MPRPDTAGRILVVDDEPALREVMSDLFAEAGYGVAACASGREALDALTRDTYDAVLTDVLMPDMNGLDLLRAVRENDLDLPVVLFTGGPSLESAIAAVEYGALLYLVKPVSAQTLLATTERAVKLGALARLKRQALAGTSLERLASDRAGLEGSFARALRGLWMAYQPISGASDGAVQAHEALLRTTDPAFPHPGAFLAAAEQLGRLPDVGRAIRKSVAGLLGSGALPRDVFVNLHPLDLADDELLDPGAPLSRFASRVVLEITERASLGGVADVAERVRSLRTLGYRIALDDLGAGYAGLNTFVALAPDIVKLDMALVRCLDRDAVKQKLVGAMTRMCHDLGIVVVAEGVETEGERVAARDAGCELLQGFLLGRPSAVPL